MSGKDLTIGLETISPFPKLNRKRSDLMVEVIKIINGLEKGKYAKLQTFNNEANNIKNYISKNRDILSQNLEKYTLYIEEKINRCTYIEINIDYGMV